MFTHFHHRSRGISRRSRHVYIALLVVAALGWTFGAHGRTRLPAALAAEVSPTTTPISDSSEAPVFNPFPATDGMTETVQLVLNEYQQAGGGMSVQAEPAVGPVAVPAVLAQVYLPLVVKGTGERPATPTPTSIPPTATPTSIPPTATPTSRPPGERADVSVTLWPAPSIRIARDGTIAYEVRVKNYGGGAAGSTWVKLPYNRQQMIPSGSRFSKQGDWVSEVTDTSVTLSFGPVAPGEYRVGTLFMRINGTLANNTVLHMRAAYGWGDGRGNGSGTTNWTPLLVGSSSDSAAWVWLTVDPVSGSVGTTHQFFTDRFIPGEGIITWLNTPSGVKPLDLRGTADSMGRITMPFRSTGLAPGTYSLVLYGARSNLTAVATFYVR